MCTARLFSQESTYLHSNFTWTGLPPINHSWHQNTRDTGLPDDEDRIPLCSLFLTQFRSVTDRRTDGHTHRQTDMMQHIQPLAKLALRRAVKRWCSQNLHFRQNYERTKTKQLDSMRWFFQRRSPMPHFGGAYPRGYDPKFELGRDFCIMHLPQVSSSYV